MRIGIIWYGSELNERGISQLSRCLIGLGHEPFIVPRGENSEGKSTALNGIRVIVIFPGSHRWTRVASSPFPLNLNWTRWVIKLAKKYAWEALFVREIPLSLPVLLAGRRLSIPVFLDMRENLAAMYRVGRAKNIALRLVRHPGIVRLYERVTLRHFRHIFAVSSELRDWLIRTHYIPQEKVSILENTPHENFLHAANKALKKNDQNMSIRLVYAGVIKERKGLGDIISAMPYVLRACSEVNLRIIGEGQDLDKMQLLVRKLDLSHAVEFLPMLSMREYVDSLSDCDVGIESCWLNELTQQTVPGKLFEYMALGLPVLSSARKPVIRILTETGCGRVYHSREPQDIARVILEMIHDKVGLDVMKRKGRKAVLTRYNWKSNLSTLRSVLKSVDSSITSLEHYNLK